MSELISIETKSIREDILGFEALIMEQPNSFKGDTDNCPLKHSFADGIYVREIFIPAGIVLTGKIHRHAHPNFLMKGEVEVFTESGGMETLVAPLSMISKAGTKRVVKTLTDTVWITVHHNPDNITDTDKIEKFVIAESYEVYEKFIESKGGYINRISNFVKRTIKKLSK
jgi:hypothetical protein